MYVLFISFSLRYDSCCMYELFLFDCSCFVHFFLVNFWFSLHVWAFSFWLTYLYERLSRLPFILKVLFHLVDNLEIYVVSKFEVGWMKTLVSGWSKRIMRMEKNSNPSKSFMINVKNGACFVSRKTKDMFRNTIYTGRLKKPANHI